MMETIQNIAVIILLGCMTALVIALTIYLTGEIKDQRKNERR
jgi:hypothetical protein